jgi:hypothetical protein
MSIPSYQRKGLRRVDKGLALRLAEYEKVGLRREGRFQKAQEPLREIEVKERGHSLRSTSGFSALDDTFMVS